MKKKIVLGMKKVKRGSMTHDSFKHRVHCIGMFSFCARPTTHKFKGKLHAQCAFVVVAIAGSPLSKLLNESNGKAIQILLLESCENILICFFLQKVIAQMALQSIIQMKSKRLLSMLTRA